MLVHSSVSGARQWRRLMDDLKTDFHVRAVNLFGYGKTPPWSIEAPQSLEDQARLVETALPDNAAASFMATDPPKEWPTRQTPSAFAGNAVSTRRA